MNRREQNRYVTSSSKHAERTIVSAPDGRRKKFAFRISEERIRQRNGGRSISRFNTNLLGSLLSLEDKKNALPHLKYLEFHWLLKEIVCDIP